MASARATMPSRTGLRYQVRSPTSSPALRSVAPTPRDGERRPGTPEGLLQVRLEADDLGLVEDPGRQGRQRAGEQRPEAGPGRHPLPEHADDEGDEERHVEEREQRLDVVHDVAVAGGDERGADADADAGDGDQPPDPQVV